MSAPAGGRVTLGNAEDFDHARGRLSLFWPAILRTLASYRKISVKPRKRREK
jgi:hypothetical protein